MREKCKIKDLVLVAAFALLGVIFMYVLPMAFIFTPYTILISPIFQALFLSVPFFLTGNKVDKKWAMLIYCTVWGISGVMPYYILAMVSAGLAAEFLTERKPFGSFGSLQISFAIAMFMHYLGGTVIPYILTKGAEYEMIRRMYGESYASQMQSLKTVPFMIAVAVLVVAVSFVGGYLSRKLLRKHFR